MSTSNSGFPIVDRSELIEHIRKLFQQKGDATYAGEAVSQTEHALQCGSLAVSEDAPRPLIAAAFLHDIGHLLHDLDENCAEEGIDDLHEQLGGQWLERYFPLSVTQPVTLHVAAKRYRCSIDQRYHDCLSEASKLSLKLQGGPMNAAEREVFEGFPFHKEALMLRRWDEAAKVPNYPTPALAYFLEVISEFVIDPAQPSGL